MARRTWILILLIIIIFGASFIGAQVYIYQKCVSAFKEISLPSTKATFERFNFQIHRSKLLLSDISIKNKTLNMQIKELDIQFHPSIFSEGKLLIEQVNIKGLLLPINSYKGKVFSKFFKSHLKLSKVTLPLMIEKLIITDIRVPNKKLLTQKNSNDGYIKRYKLKSRISKLNGSMDFLVHVIYFILQNSLAEVQK